MDSKDLLPALKEPQFFDDWAAENFKVINLPPDWLAAHQSPYQILRSDPSVPQMVQGYQEKRKLRAGTTLVPGSSALRQTRRALREQSLPWLL